jgi:hypothetical protein
MPYAYFNSIFGSGYVTKKNKKKEKRRCVAKLGCYYCSKLLLYSQGPVVFTNCSCNIVNDWSTFEPGGTLAIWRCSTSADCVTFVPCANACCGCGIAPTPIKDIADSSSAAAIANI